MVKIRQAFSYVSRGKSPNYVETSITKVINQACIYWDGLHLENVKYQDSEKVKTDRYLHNNDVLINSTGTGTLGRCCVFKSNADDVNYVADSHVTVLRPSDDICASYFKYFVMKKETQDSIYSKCVSGSTNQIELSKEKLLEFLIPLPPIEAQKKIAQSLDTVAELLALRKQQLAELDNLIQSTFYAMFGDPVANEKGWDTFKSNKYSELLTVGVVVKPASYYTDSGIVALRSLNIKPNYIDLNNLVYFSEESSNGVLAKSVLRQDDVVIVRTGMTGTAAVIPKELDGANCIDLIIVRPNKIMLNPYYLVFLLNSEKGKKLVASKEVGGIQKHFNIGAMKDISLPIPPLSLQTQFAAIVSKIEAQKSLVRQAVDEAQYLLDSLMSEYFAE